jgi:outer membrane protein assembly factor BamB
VKHLPYDEQLGPERYHGMSPYLVDNTIYQGNGKDAFVAVSRDSGREKWRRLIENGVTSGAQVYEGNLYFGTSDGQFYCVDSTSGELVWTFPLRAEVFNAPLIQDGVVYFLAANNIVYAIDAKTGKQIWLYNRTDTTTLSIRGSAKPIFAKGNLYIGFSDGFFVAVNAKTGSLVWERNLNKNPKFKDVNATAVLDGNSVYVSSYDDSLYKLSLDDGQIQWRLEKGGHSPVTLVGDRLYYATSEGEVLALNKANGAILWSYKLREGVATQPMKFNELLVFGESRGNLKVLNAADGAEVTKFASGWGLVASPTVDESMNRVYFISNAGNLYALQFYWEKRNQKFPWETR